MHLSDFYLFLCCFTSQNVHLNHAFSSNNPTQSQCHSLLSSNQPNISQQFSILIQVVGFSIISTKLFITSQRFLTIKHEGKETRKKNQTKIYTNMVKNFLFYWMFQAWILGTEREKRWKSRVSYFLFLLCLWEDGRLTGSNLYPAVEDENSGIWTCSCLDLLPSLLLFNTDHSMVRASCLIISFCLCLIEFKVPSNSPWAK